jgi:hypothetical protein
LQKAWGALKKLNKSSEPAIPPEDELRCAHFGKTHVLPKLSYNQLGLSVAYVKSRAAEGLTGKIRMRATDSSGSVQRFNHQ